MPTRPPGTPDIDLTFDDTFGILNGAVFATGLNQPAGTGAFDSFVQLQNGGTEQGYNTDASAQYDEKNSQNHNHSILLADVPIVFGDGTNGTVEGVAYREFLLDLNEPNGSQSVYFARRAADLAGRSRRPHRLHARRGICRRPHQLSRLRSRCRRRPLDRAQRRALARQRPERHPRPDPGQLLHQRRGASLRHALFQFWRAAWLGYRRRLRGMGPERPERRRAFGACESTRPRRLRAAPPMLRAR